MFETKERIVFSIVSLMELYLPLSFDMKIRENGDSKNFSQSLWNLRSRENWSKNFEQPDLRKELSDSHVSRIIDHIISSSFK